MGQNGEVVSLYLEEVVGGFDLYGVKLDKEKLADKQAFPSEVLRTVASST